MITPEKLHVVLDDASIDRVWGHTEWMSREVPERVSGWPAAQTQADYLTGQLRSYGFEAHQDPFLGLVSRPGRGA